MTTATDARTWTVHDVADFLGVPIQTLYQWRYLRTGPPAYRVGRHLRYLPDEVFDWLRKQTEPEREEATLADVDDRWHRTITGPDGEPVKVRAARYGQGKRWVARWRDAQGRQRKKSFARKADADRHAAKMTTDIAAGTYIDPAAGKTTFKAYAEDWRAAQPHRPNTAKAVRQHLLCYAYPAFGARPIAAIRPSEVQAWVAGLNLAPSTTKTVFNTVKGIFRAAVRDRIVTFNPCDGVKLPKVPRKRVEPLTQEQVAALAGAIPRRYRALVLAAVATGLRPGELFGLDVGHVDFLRRTVTVEQQLQQTARSGVYLGPPKTKTSYRTIPVPKTVTDMLAAHLATYSPGEVAVPWGNRDGEEVTSQFVFSAPAGGPIVRTSFFNAAWWPAVKAAGLAGIGMHLMRHTYASALIAAGLSVRVVSARLGHTNAAMTLNTYSHLWPDDEDLTREAVAGWLGVGVPHMWPNEARG